MQSCRAAPKNFVQPVVSCTFNRADHWISKLICKGCFRTEYAEPFSICREQGGQGDLPGILAICELLVDDRDDMIVKAISCACAS
jgi:hypothetical protein